MKEYIKLCNIIAARRCRNAGQSVKEIAKSAGVLPSMVYRWLRVSCRS